MQRHALTVDKFIDHAARWAPQRGIAWAEPGTAVDRIGYAALRERSNRLSGALLALGLGTGDRVGTLAWNTRHHLETYYATMGAGLVCHTLNPRFTVQHLAAIIDEADDRVLAVSANLWPLLCELLPLCPRVEHIVILDETLPDDAALPGTTARLWSHESLIDALGTPVTWGAFEEDAPAGLCYTSGTTGAPKGVLYTHRSNYLHTLRSLQAEAMALTRDDSVLVGVPMFHANGWGLPFAAPAVGAKLVLPGRHADGAHLARLMREEAVTIAVGVYTLWLGVVDHVEATGETLPDLKRVLIGGSRCPESLIHRIEERLGVQVQTSWGMTELSPLGTIAPPGVRWSEAQGSGRAPMGLDMRVIDADGVPLTQQHGNEGQLQVRGASVVDRYYLANEDAVDADGWFDTGDLASFDEAGHLSIHGRAKDLIKSGGEWINPAEMEDVIGRHPAVRQVAVVARPDPKWGERPVLFVELHEGQALDSGALLACLQDKVAKWWLPDAVFALAAMPLAATGKIDKQRLRAEATSFTATDVAAD